MNEKHSLPKSGRLFEIRFESIKGLGAQSASQILATAAVRRLNMNCVHFSSSTSEENGSVVRSFVRLSDVEKPIKDGTPIEPPDLIVVFHRSLFDHPATIAGMRAGGTLIYNSPDIEPHPALSLLPHDARIIRIDATGIARVEESKPEAVMLGVLSAVFPFLNGNSLLMSLIDEFGPENRKTAAACDGAYWRGAEEFKVLEDVAQGIDDLPLLRFGAVWGFDMAMVYGSLPKPGDAALSNNFSSQTGSMPVLKKEICLHCGLCDLICPNLCLVWSSNINGSVILNGIDYRFCQGCLRCVETCPTGAMSGVTIDDCKASVAHSAN